MVDSDETLSAGTPCTDGSVLPATSFLHVQNSFCSATSTAFSQLHGVCRFRCTNQLAHLFAAIDVHTQGQDLPPGSYRLVAQYPRRVFTDDTPGSLRDVGLAEAKQETVLVETID